MSNIYYNIILILEFNNIYICNTLNTNNKGMQDASIDDRVFGKRKNRYRIICGSVCKPMLLCDRASINTTPVKGGVADKVEEPKHQF